MISRILLLLLPLVNSQIIDVTVCADDVCNDGCINWRINSGDCAVCQGGVCSLSNPSSITTATSITFYSDIKCTNLIPGTYKMPIVLDNQCSRLQLGGSYRAKNVSAIIGASFVGVFILILLIICCLRNIGVKCCCCNRQQPVPNSTAVIITDQNNPQVIDYFSKNDNSQTYGYPVSYGLQGQQNYTVAQPNLAVQPHLYESNNYPVYPQTVVYPPTSQLYGQYNNQNTYPSPPGYYPPQNSYATTTSHYSTAPAPSAPYSASYNHEPKVV